MSDLNLRFLPWLRRGLARSIPASTDSAATIAFSLKVGGGLVEQSLRMRGPGDVVGIDPAQIIRVEPRPGTTDFEPNYFPAVEFATPDLPWMFTPTAPDADNHLLPWLALVTVSADVATIETRAGAPLPVLTVPPSELPPDPGELWGWAHVQNTDLYDLADLTQALNETPEAFISRILSPRNLRPDVGYLACLVPTYEAGRLAGLGLPVGADIGQVFAWDAGSSSAAELPVYYWWSFHTAQAGDFETLVARLEPRELDETVGRHALDISELVDLGILPPDDLPQTTYFFGALVSSTAMLNIDEAHKPPTFPPSLLEPFPIDLPPLPGRPDPVRAALYTFLTPEVGGPQDGPYDYRVDDPVVTPALYGREQLAGAPLPAPGAVGPYSLLAEEPIWYSVANTLPRTRGAAGLGMRLVRRHQEDFMARAWSEVADLRAINQSLQQATYASLVASRWQGRIAALDDGEALQLTRIAHARILPASGQTIWGQVRAASVPAGVISTGFQRMLRTGGVIYHTLRLTADASLIQHEIRRIAVANPSRLMALSAHPLPGGAQVIGTASDEGHELTVRTYTGPLSGAVVQIENRLDRVLASGVQTAERPEITDAALTANQLASRHVTYLDALVERGQTLTPAMTATRSAAMALIKTTNQYVNQVNTGALPTVKQISAIRTQARTLNDALNNWLQTGGDIILTHDGPIPEETATTLKPIAAALQTALTPTQTIGSYLQSRIVVTGGGWGERLIPTRFLAEPLFDDALYRYVCELNPEYMLPGIGDIPQNTVGLLEVNGEFVEAVLIGSNHEMSREMRWREYPANLRSTWFRRFWSATADDIGPIGDPGYWTGDHTLGENIIGPMKDATLVLLIKGDILRRYPNMAVYALPATVAELPDEQGQLRRVRMAAEPEVPQYPVFTGELDNGVKFFGFEDLLIPDVLGTATPTNVSTDGGYFFVLQEQPTEPRFELNEYEPGGTYNPTSVGDWSELSWGHFMPGDDPDLPPYLPIAGAFDGVALPDTAEADARNTTWGRHAAAMARIVLQRPVRMLVHASAMLP